MKAGDPNESLQYKDYSHEPIDDLRSGSTANSSHFPSQLHHMLSQAEGEGYSDICSWRPHGRAFFIHNREAFVEKVMSRYFQQVSAVTALSSIFPACISRIGLTAPLSAILRRLATARSSDS